MSKVKPPNWARRFFEWYCNPCLQESILGDLEEQFEIDIGTHGLKRAKRRFAWNVIRFFRRSIIKHAEGTRKLNYYGMLKHYIKLSFRGFKRFKTSFVINLIGLSSGLASVFLIYLWINDELPLNLPPRAQDQ